MHTGQSLLVSYPTTFMHLLSQEGCISVSMPQLRMAATCESSAGSVLSLQVGGSSVGMHAGTPGQYWRTLEEVEAEGSNPVSRDAPSSWVRSLLHHPASLFTDQHLVPSMLSV